MSEGVFALHRGIFNHPHFDGDEFSRRDAWVWLLGNAVWKDTRTRIGGSKTVDLKRGQLAYAYRFLAVKWRWSEARVRRFVGALRHERMIDAEVTRWGTIITICNYDKYQLSPKDNDAEVDREVTRKRRGSDAKKNKDNKLIKESISPATREEDDRGFEDFWKAFPRRSTASPKKPAKLRYQAALKRGVSPEAILAGARAYAAEQEREGKVGTPYVKTPEVWINKECWTAFEAQPTGPPLPTDPIARRDQIWKEIEAENAKRATEAASRNLLAGSFGLGEEKQSGPEKPCVVRADERNAKGASGVVELFPEPSRVSAEGDEDADRRPAIRIPLPRSMA